MDQFITQAKSNPLAKGINEIFLPGEIELKLRQQRMIEGLSSVTLADLRREGEISGIEYDLK